MPKNPNKIIKSHSKLKRLNQASIDAGTVPFWNEDTATTNSQLWSPQFHTQDTELIDGFVNDDIQSSVILRINGPTIDYECKNDKTILRCRKFRIFPDQQQIKQFQKCFDVSRYIYNKTIAYLKNSYQERKDLLDEMRKNGCTKNIGETTDEHVQCGNTICENSRYHCSDHIDEYIDWNLSTSFKHISPSVMGREKYGEIPPEEMWITEVYFDTRQEAIKDACDAYKSYLKLKKIDQKYNPPGFKSRNSNKQIFHVSSKNYNRDMYVFPQTLDTPLKPRRSAEKWFRKLLTGKLRRLTIVRERPGKYYACLPVDVDKHKIKGPYKLVSLDPGVRTFQTFYSSDGVCGKLGDNEVETLAILGEKIAKISSLIDTMENRITRRNMKNRRLKMFAKLRNKVRDLHFKTANFLCENFEIIMIPI